MGPIVVGVQLEIPDEVVQQAAHVATELGTQLVCAHVETRSPVGAGFIGSAAALGAGMYMPTEADVVEAAPRGFDPELHQRIADALRDANVTWRTTQLIGDPATALGRLAHRLDAPMIVVGTREPGITRTVHDFFTGSVAVRLAHEQHRPVLVIPRNPVTTAEDFP